MMKEISVADVIKEIRPGDVLAFGGKGFPSDWIKFFNKTNVSHLGIAFCKARTEPNFFLGEATRDGVLLKGIIDCINHYDGEVWWLPLSDKARKEFSEDRFFDFFLKNDGKGYDFLGAAEKLFQQLVSNHHAKEDMSRYFCSEIVAAGLRESGVLPKDINISEVTPIDLCTFNIYSDEYFFIKGDKQEIFKFNTVDPMTWEHMGCK